MSKKLFYYGSTASLFGTRSAQFDGVNEYHTSNLLLKTVLGSFQNCSYSFWIKTTHASAVLNLAFGSNSTATTYQYFRLNFSATGNIAFLSRGSLGSQYRASASTSINDGNWHHVCLTKSGGTSLNMYIDGVLNNGAAFISGSGGYNIADDTRPIYCAVVGTTYIPITLYQMVIYDKALSALEAAEVYGLKGTDLRSSFSASGNIVFYIEWKDAIPAFPTIPELITSTNGSMVNMEIGDISTDIP